MNEAIEIEGIPELAKAGAFVLSEVVRAIADDGGDIMRGLTLALGSAEQPMLLFRVLPNGAGCVAELVTMRPGAVCFTRHAVLPMLKKNTGTALN